MPISYVPLIVTCLVIGVPLGALLKSFRAGTVAAVVSLMLVGGFLISVYSEGWSLHRSARAGDAAAQYQYAQWVETHTERISAFILWPADIDVLDGYAWLERSATQDYPPAVWLVGVRLKYGVHVPRPVLWKGASGNVFEQPDRGQALIDRAMGQLGYHPPVSERTFYWCHYRRGLAP